MAFSSNEIRFKQLPAKKLARHLAEAYSRQQHPLPTKKEIREQVGVVKKLSLARKAPRGTIEEEVRKLEEQLHAVVTANSKLLGVQKKDEESVNLLRAEINSLRESLDESQSKFEKELGEKNKKINELLESFLRQATKGGALRERDRKHLAELMGQKINQLEKKHTELSLKGYDKEHLEKLKKKITASKKHLEKIKGK